MECVPESASGTFQSTGRKPGDILTSEHRVQARWSWGAGNAGGPQAGACGSDRAYPSRRKCHAPTGVN